MFVLFWFLVFGMLIWLDFVGGWVLGKLFCLFGVFVGSLDLVSCDEVGGKKVDNMDSYCRIEVGLEMG